MLNMLFLVLLISTPLFSSESNQSKENKSEEMNSSITQARRQRQSLTEEQEKAEKETKGEAVFYINAENKGRDSQAEPALPPNEYPSFLEGKLTETQLIALFPYHNQNNNEKNNSVN